MSEKVYKTVEEFYPFYLSQHLDPICRYLHVYGTSLGLMVAVMMIIKGYFYGLFVGLAIGYGCSWIGHFVFEKNRPATFKYPLFSFKCDFFMIRDFFTGDLQGKIDGINASLK